MVDGADGTVAGVWCNTIGPDKCKTRMNFSVRVVENNTVDIPVNQFLQVRALDL